MPTPGPLELVIILVIALIILGPGKLPDVGASLGKSIREFRKASSDIQESVTVKVDTSPLPPQAARRPSRARPRSRPRRSPLRCAGSQVQPRLASQARAPRAPGRSASSSPELRHRNLVAHALRTSAWPTLTRCVRPAFPVACPPPIRSPAPAPLTPAPAACPRRGEGDDARRSPHRAAPPDLHLHCRGRRGQRVGFYFSGQLISILKSPLPLDLNGQERVLNFLAPGEAFFIYVKLALVVGIILAMPVILFQVWRFISPGLTPTERRAARPWVPIALLFFLIGVAVAWVVLPFALQFLVGFESKDFHYLPTAEAYFGFIATLFLAFGLTMEFPIVLVLLSKVGIITSQRLRSSRRIVILGIAVFSAVVTPGGDLVSPTVLGVVMYLLYELSIRLVKMGGR